MVNLFVTWDQIGSSTGGGIVTANELKALQTIDETYIINPPMTNDPFEADEIALQEYKNKNIKPKLAHFYANTYSQLIKLLKKDGVKITYTIAAHNIQHSQEEHENLGIPFNLPHLTDPNLFKKYIEGILLADVVITPSHYSKHILECFGCKNVQVIPHGIDIPWKPKKIKEFSVGYLGSSAPDKGLKYLIEAWSLLNYKDTLLTIAGRNSESLLPLVRQGKGNVHLAGFVEDTSTLYNSCNVYVQPSVTEGFGIEVLEAMSYGKGVICSMGAGATQCINSCGRIVPIRHPQAIASAIDYYKNNPEILQADGELAQTISKDYSWGNIIKQYCKVWNNVLTAI